MTREDVSSDGHTLRVDTFLVFACPTYRRHERLHVQYLVNNPYGVSSERHLHYNHPHNSRELSRRSDLTRVTHIERGQQFPFNASHAS
jgi:hypothetical protein